MRACCPHGLWERCSNKPAPPSSPSIAQGFFDTSVPVESLRATALAVPHIAKLRLRDPVVVAPNESCIPLAHDFRAGLARVMGEGGSGSGGDAEVGFAVMIEAGASRGTDRYVHNRKAKREDSPIDLVGEVAGRDCVIVDDMIDTGYTLMKRLGEACRPRGGGGVGEVAVVLVTAARL
jgi:phosphoribosylpyrophosphate synthetase